MQGKGNRETSSTLKEEKRRKSFIGFIFLAAFIYDSWKLLAGKWEEGFQEFRELFLKKKHGKG